MIIIIYPKDYLTCSLQHLQNTARHNTNLSMELSVSILTHGFWPSYPDSELILSPEMVQYQKIFTEFYRNKHSGRKLMVSIKYLTNILRFDRKKYNGRKLGVSKLSTAIN
jgi:hypothetical protein